MKVISRIDDYWADLEKHIQTVIQASAKQHSDIPPMIVPVKNGEILCFINPTGDRDQYLSIMRLLIRGIELDELVFISDSYISSSTTKHDGTPWDHGEMAKAYLDMTADADLVSENIMAIRLRRDGRLQSYSQDYRRNEDDTVTLAELRASDSTKDGPWGGYVIEELKKAYEAQTFRQWSEEKGQDPFGEVSEDTFTAYALATIIKNSLIPMGCSVMMLARGKDNSQAVVDYLKQDDVDYTVLTEPELKSWIGVPESDETGEAAV